MLLVFTYFGSCELVRSDLLQDAFNTVRSAAVMPLEFWPVTPEWHAN